MLERECARREREREREKQRERQSACERERDRETERLMGEARARGTCVGDGALVEEAQVHIANERHLTTCGAYGGRDPLVKESRPPYGEVATPQDRVGSAPVTDPWSRRRKCMSNTGVRVSDTPILLGLSVCPTQVFVCLTFLSVPDTSSRASNTHECAQHKCLCV